MDARKKQKLIILLEDIIILLAIPVLWFTIFRLEGAVYDVIKYLTLFAMVFIFVRRFGRIRSHP